MLSIPADCDLNFCAAAEYMRLPASQYSVLDAQKVERLDEDTFRCYVGGLSFLGFTVKPVLTVSVIVKERGPIVKLLNTQVSLWFCFAGGLPGWLCVLLCLCTQVQGIAECSHVIAGHLFTSLSPFCSS